MRKIVSSILALVMALSLCTISVQAGTESKYALTYEAIGDADINNLKAGDMFWAVVTLKDAEGIFGAGVGLSWDNTKIQTVNASGASNKVFGVITEAASRIVNTAKTTGMSMDSGEMEQVAAFEANTQSATDNSITYEFSAAMVYDENGIEGFNDYSLNGDTTIVKVRFKVLEAADPSITVTKSVLRQTKASTLDTITFDVAAFPIGGGEEDKTEASIGSTGDVTFDYAEGDSASSALSGQRVVLDTAGNKITGDVKDKKVAVTYTEAGAEPIVKTFGETLNELLGLDGDGSVTATVRFGVVCDPLLTGTFTFAIVD